MPNQRVFVRTMPLLFSFSSIAFRFPAFTANQLAELIDIGRAASMGRGYLAAKEHQDAVAVMQHFFQIGGHKI
jgi:hypothetical protein